MSKCSKCDDTGVYDYFEQCDCPAAAEVEREFIDEPIEPDCGV